MIRVKKVVGESFDLETGDGTGKALLLVNDKGDTLLLEVDEQSVHAVLQLMAADMKPEEAKTAPPIPAPSDALYVRSDDLYVEPQYSVTEPDDDFDPGEQYGDGSSGLPSI